MSHIVRLAICQLACHPAIQTAHLMYLAEPFIPGNHKICLSSLSINGFQVDSLLETCKERYIGWHRDRLRSIFSSLSNVNPNLTIFSEGAIPCQCLDLVKEFSDKTGSEIFAGTHTFQKTRKSQKRYLDVGVKEKSIERLKKSQGSNIAPVFINKKVHCFQKDILSPFEKNDISEFEFSKKPIVPLKVNIQGKDISILLLICSEALNFSKIKVQGDYELVVILSFDSQPTNFDTVTSLLVSNNKAVAYCNDGHFGKSKIQLPIDNRVPFWWFDSNLGGALPAGDSILVADIDFHNLAPQVGITEPLTNFRLVKLYSVSYSGDPDTCYATLRAQTAVRTGEDTLKVEVLKEISMSDKCDILQKAKYTYLANLAASGQNFDEWWNRIGEDLIINLPSLKQLECDLSKLCYSKLADQLVEIDSNTQGYEYLKAFLKEAKLRSGAMPEAKKMQPHIDRHATIINRDEDSKNIVDFFDHKYQRIIHVSGIQQIGKTSAVQKALDQCKFDKVTEIEIFNTSSADYIIRKLYYGWATAENTPTNESRQLKDSDIEKILESHQVIWFHRTENLTSQHNWRNADISNLFSKFIKLCSLKSCKIILETRVSLPLDIDNPNTVAKKRIYGLEGGLSKHGVTYLDYQLRRVDLSPNDIDTDTKSYIVEKLGGHPFAISLCADAIVDEGLTTVVEYLKNKKGFYLNFVNHIIQAINLSEQEKTILKLLSSIRLSIPREVVLQTFNDVATLSLNNLLQLCLIEIDTNSNIRLPGLLKSYFDSSELNEEMRLKFHRNCGNHFFKAYENDKSKIEFAIEADVHNSMGGCPTNIADKLFDGQVEIAKRNYENQDYQLAKKAIDKIPELNRTQDVLRLSALVDAKCNQFDSALRSALKVFKYNRSDTFLLSQISRIALSQGRDDIAENLISIARAAQMEDTSILLVEGRMLLRRNDLSRAEDVFLQALKLTRTNPWPYFFLGKIYIRLGELDQAIDILYNGEKFIYDGNIRSENALAAIRTQLGIAYLLDDKIDLAEQTIRSLYQERNKDPEVIRAYAMISLRKDGIDKAFEAFQRLSQGKIKSKYDQAQFHLYYGIFYLGIGDKGSASIEFAKAHQADNNNVYIMMKLAKTYYDLAIETWIDGEIEFAKSYASDCAIIAKKILEFDSDNQIGKDIQIELYAKFGLELSKA